MRRTVNDTPSDPVLCATCDRAKCNDRCALRLAPRPRVPREKIPVGGTWAPEESPAQCTMFDVGDHHEKEWKAYVLGTWPYEMKERAR